MQDNTDNTDKIEEINKNENIEEPATAKPPQWMTGGDDAEAVEDPQDEFNWQGDGKSSGKPMVVLLLCAFVGMIGLYFFGIKQKPAELSDEQIQAEAKIDVAIAKLTNNTNNIHSGKTTEEIVKSFYEYPMNQQVALDDLNKNPFAWVQNDDNEAEQAQDISNKAKHQRETELQKAFGNLKLQSVFVGSKSSRCIISDQTYTIGQTVENFTVIKIDAQQVTLQADEMEFTLQL